MTLNLVYKMVKMAVCQEMCKFLEVSVALAGTVIFRSLTEQITA
jgi:hypothetical protein